MTGATINEKEYKALSESGLFADIAELDTFVNLDSGARAKKYNEMFDAAVAAERRGLDQELAALDEYQTEIDARIDAWFENFGADGKI